jgi:hypothetical protein
MVGRARTEARLGTGDVDVVVVVVVVVRRWPPCDRSIANKRQCALRGGLPSGLVLEVELCMMAEAGL